MPIGSDLSKDTLQDKLHWPTRDMPAAPQYFKPEYMDVSIPESLGKRLTPVIGYKAAYAIVEYVQNYSAKPKLVEDRALKQWAENGSKGDHLEITQKIRNRYNELQSIHKEMLAKSEYRPSAPGVSSAAPNQQSAQTRQSAPAPKGTPRPGSKEAAVQEKLAALNQQQAAAQQPAQTGQSRQRPGFRPSDGYGHNLDGGTRDKFGNERGGRHGANADGISPNDELSRRVWLREQEARRESAAPSPSEKAPGTAHPGPDLQPQTGRQQGMNAPPAEKNAPAAEQGKGGAKAMLGLGTADVTKGIIHGNPDEIAQGSQSLIVGGAGQFAPKRVAGAVNRFFIPVAVTKLGIEAAEKIAAGEKRGAGDGLVMGGASLAGGLVGGAVFEAGAVSLGAASGGLLAASIGTGGAMLIGAAVGAGVYAGHKAIDQAFFGSEDKRFTQADLQNKSHVQGLRSRAYVEAVMGKVGDQQSDKNWGNIGKLNELEIALQREIDKQKDIMDKNESILPRYVSPALGPSMNEALVKTEMARSEINILKSAKQEVNQYITEIREAPRRKEQQKELHEASGKLYIAIFNKNAEARGIKLNECDEKTLKWLDDMSMLEARKSVQKLVDARRPKSIEDNDRLIGDVKKETEAAKNEHKRLYDQHLPDRAYVASRKQFEDLLADMGGKRPDAETAKPRIKLHIGTEQSVASRLSAIEAQAGLAIGRFEGGKTTQQRIERLAEQFDIDIREYGLHRARDNREVQNHAKGVIEQAFHDGRLKARLDDTASTPITGEKARVFIVTGTPEELKAFSNAMQAMGIDFKSDRFNQHLAVDVASLEKLLPKGASFDAMLPPQSVREMQAQYEWQAKQYEKETGKKLERPKEEEFVRAVLKRLDKDGDGKITTKDFDINSDGKLSEGEKALLKDAAHALKGSLSPEATAAISVIQDIAASNGIKLDSNLIPPLLIPPDTVTTTVASTKKER